MKTKDKKVYLEILRIISIFFALYCHTGFHAVGYYTVHDGWGTFLLGIMMRGLSLLCNTTFFLVSGALLLQKEESISKVWQRVVKCALVIVIFSVFQFLYTYVRYPRSGINVVEYLKEIYEGPVVTQYWFLYAYLGLLISLPLLRAMAKGMEEKHYVYLLGIYLAVKLAFPIMDSVFDLSGFGVELPLFADALIVPLTGHFLEHVSWEKICTKRNLILVNVSGILALLLNVALVAYKYRAGAEVAQYGGMILLTSVMLFVDVKMLCTRFSMPAVCKNLLLFLGNGVFGVFLLEPQLREGFFFIYKFSEPYITWLPATVLWLGAAMVTGCVLMNVLKKIPGVKKLF